MLTLSWWEQFIVNATISMLSILQSKLTNKTEQAALMAAIAFLQQLLAGQVSVT